MSKKALLIGGAIVVAVIAIAHTGSDKSSADSTSTAASTPVADTTADTTSSDPNISVVAAKSTCVSTGVDNYYTGNGKVMFAFTLHNSGGEGKVNVTPVRHYSDGNVNESAMDMMVDVPVPGHSTKRFSSEQMTYKAHEHEIVSCGLMLDGGSEIPIAATGI